MTLSLSLEPASVALTPGAAQQLCYVLVTVAATARQRRPVNWALVADASKSMRIPIISDSEFRALVRAGGAQEALVDGVPVWQLTGSVPDELRNRASSAIDHVARALHSVVEQLDAADRFTLIACAESAVLVVPSTPGDGRAALVQGIGRLKALDLGDDTDLAEGLRLALNELAAGRQTARVERLLLLTDGFTRQPDVCRSLAREAAAAGVAISTLGLGGEFQEDLLTALADSSGGRALFVRHAEDIPAAVTRELALARKAAATATSLSIRCGDGVTVRHITRLAPVLTSLEPLPSRSRPGEQVFLLGEIAVAPPTQVLLELLITAPLSDPKQLAHLTLIADATSIASSSVAGSFTSQSVTPAPGVLTAAARANIARLQRRAMAALHAGQRDQAIILLNTIAKRLDDLGEHTVAITARHEAISLEQTGRTTRLGPKELTYATRRIGVAGEPRSVQK